MKRKNKISGYVIRSAAIAVVLSSALIAFTLAINVPSRPPSLSGVSQPRQLTFTDRVAYQRAIEEVYWHHRIWPKENTASKPSLDAVMSQAQLEKKVAEYLRESQALEDYRQRPITPEELQAEMDRIARNTRQPDTLREIFAALGNDAAVIAECVARPVLAERLVRDLAAQDEQFRTQLAALPSCTAVLQVNSDDADPRPAAGDDPKAPRLRTMSANEAATYRLPAITSTPTTCFDDWVPTGNSGEVPGRYGHTAVWTGSEMIVWGGNNGAFYPPEGGRYNPTTDSWTATSATNEPLGRGAPAVWTGTEMIVWGGTVPEGGGYTNTGGRYNPATDSWIATSTTNAPEARSYHTAVWTGTEMIAWGGASELAYENTGGRYNPATDGWTATSLPFVSCPPDGVCLLEGRYSHTAVWTGTEMIVWGGGGGTLGVLNDGGRYNPSSDTWAATNFNNAPDPRYYHTAVWTGTEMIIWGGDVCLPSCSNSNTGGRYNPTTDSWSVTSLASAPVGRFTHTAVWTGNEMIVWGGDGDSGLLDTGGRYNPSNDSWTDTTMSNAPEARTGHTAVWTGTEMIVWGGLNIAGNALDTGGRYCGQAVQVTVKTSPPGRSFSVDGTTYSSTQRFTWAPGSSHTIGTTSPQSGGTGVRYIWAKWSDHGAISHTVAPTANATYTATFKTQYFLTMTHGSGGRVSPASGWKNSGANVSIGATSAPAYHFTGWTGTGTGSYSGPNNPASITMGGPITETATFIHN